MRYLSEQELQQMSFPDGDVTNFSMNLSNGTLTFTCSDAFVRIKRRWFIDVHVTVTFDSVKVTEYDAEPGVHKVEVLFSKDYALKDICEFEYSNSTITMRGYTKGRGFWTEYIFSGAKMAVLCDKTGPG
ncbi:MAG: hypothetical protein HYW48_00075 [Deltaproteobacteria bacterium]|nr:hypothetical protein [Deltaproteobacteria bacterium]